MMSRLIVKNLPSYLTPDGLRKHLVQNGTPLGIITDIKISHKSDGTSRLFGFAGFETEQVNEPGTGLTRLVPTRRELALR